MSGRKKGQHNKGIAKHRTVSDYDAGESASSSVFRKNMLDEMTVGRTEKPVRGAVPEKPAPGSTQTGGRYSPLMDDKAVPAQNTGNNADDVRPMKRAKVGVGSYEDPADEKRKGRGKGKTGRPGR